MELFKKPVGNCTVTKVLVAESYYAPKVDIELNALLKMRAFIQNSTTEIAWLGTVEKRGAHYVITDVDLMKQDVSGVTAEIHESGLQEYAERLIAAGKVDDLNNIRMWGHSHVNMDVLPSGTDETTFKEYYKSCDYFIRLIANKREIMKIDVVELSTELRFDNVDWEILYPPIVSDIIDKRKKYEEDIKESCKELDSICEGMYKDLEPAAKTNILRYVKQEVYSYGNYTRKNYGGYDYDNDYDNWIKDGSYYKKKDDLTVDDDETDILFDDEDDDIFTIPSVQIHKGFVGECYIPITDMFDDEEIIYVTENILTTLDLRELLEDQPQYVNYDMGDWIDLYDAIADYHMMMMEE